ncbi:MAG: hypothetical protein V7L22_26670 [Nostoc sp.]
MGKFHQSQQTRQQPQRWAFPVYDWKRGNPKTNTVQIKPKTLVETAIYRVLKTQNCCQ